MGFVEGILDGDCALIIYFTVDALVHSDDAILFIFYLPQFIAIVVCESLEYLIVVDTLFDADIFGIVLECVVYFELFDFIELHAFEIKVGFVVGDGAVIEDGLSPLGMDEVVDQH